MSGEAGPFRVAELYCGIGGCAAALAPLPSVSTVAAIDINQGAREVYAANFPHPVIGSLIESIDVDQWRRWNADLWWLSPPCQPFTRRGLQRDIDDPRAQTFVASLDLIAAVRPRYVALENVPPFRESRGHKRLLQVLAEAGYSNVHEVVSCPTEFAIPNRRQRYYLVAAQGELGPRPRPWPQGAALADYLDATPSPELHVDEATLRRFAGALHIVDAADAEAVTNCFTSAYGRSPVRSGSYLATESGARRFSPEEILRLLGFPADFRLPPSTPARAWRWVANSLSLAPVRNVLATIPELSDLADVDARPAPS